METKKYLLDVMAKVNSCSSKAYWYSGKINQIFDVVKYSELDYLLLNDSKLILQDDAQIIGEKVMKNFETAS